MMSLNAKSVPTKRALDLWVRHGFSSIFSIPKFFLPVERISVPPTSPVTQTVETVE